MGSFLQLIFLAFLLICQLANPISAAAGQIDPNELILQRLKSGEKSSQISAVSLNNKERTVIIDRSAERKPSLKPMAIARPIVDSKQDFKVKPSASKKLATPNYMPSNIRNNIPNYIPVNVSAGTPIARPIVEKIAVKKAALDEAAKTEPKLEKVFELDKIEPASGVKALTWFSTLSDGQRMTITFNNRPNFSYDEKAGEVTFKFAGAANYEVPNIPENFRGSFQSIEVVPSGNLTIKVKHRADAKHVISSNSRRVFLDILGDTKPAPEAAKDEATLVEPEAEEEVAAEVEVEKIVENPTLATPAPEVTKTELEQNKYINYDKNIISEKDGDVESFTFKFAEKTDAALFERFGEYWLLFYTNEPLGLPNLSKSELFSEVNIVPNGKAKIYKFSMKNNAFASAMRDRNTWKIEFNPLLESPIKFPLSLKKDGEEWFVNVPGIDVSVDVKDDFTGETLTILPSQNVGEGFAQRVIYRDVIVEKSLLGIVLRKISEGSKISFNRNELRLTPSIAPRKLFAKAQAGREEVVIDKESYLIDFDQIKSNEKTLSGAEGREVGRNLDENMRGQLLFAQKFYREAAVDLGSRVGFDNSFLAAASYFLSGRYDKAVNDFERINIPPNKDPNEFLLWEIAAKQELLRQDPRAKVSAEIPAEFGLPANLKNYPVNIATALQLPLIEAALADGKTDFAELVRNNISSKSTARNLEYAQYLHAKILAAQGSIEESIEVLEKLLAKTDNREIRAVATYAKIVTALEIEKITKEEALAQLDKVRIIWRGDAAEFNTLEKIGELYADSKDYPEALLAYKTALSAIPFHPRSDQITAKMRKIYKTAMQKDFDNPEKSFDALALYYDYVELKPTGREGEYLTIELAERLVAFDLIQEGIDVLVNFVGNIKDAEEKSLISTRIAVLYYYMRQPEKALAQLELSEAEGTPKYIEWQRKILFVRILSEQEKYDEALTKINRLPPQRSSELRAEIYWSKQDWQNFIDNFNAMESKTEQNIMKAAIAYAMLSEDKALMEFQKQNSAAMEKSKYAEAFKFITQKNSIDYNDLGTSLKLDFAKQVIDNYKKDLKLTDFFGKEVAGVEVEKAASIEQ